MRRTCEAGSKIGKSRDRETGIALALDVGKPNGEAWRCGGRVLRPFENFTLCLVG